MESFRSRAQSAAKPVHIGKVQACTAESLEASFHTGPVGSVVQITSKRDNQSSIGEVIRMVDGSASILPLRQWPAFQPGDEVEWIANRLPLPQPDRCMGRVLDGTGRVLDGEPIKYGIPSSLPPTAPNPLLRRPLQQPFTTGVKSIDAFVSLSYGQRIGVLAPSGVGKTTLLHQIIHGSSADLVIVCLVGERGREIGELVSRLRPPANADHVDSKWIVVASTAADPPLARMHSLDLATRIAEWHREAGSHVLLIVDSLTKYARAARDVGLASGEIPATRGYPPSVLTKIPRLIERTGSGPKGSITAIYSLLLDEDQIGDPIAEEAKASLDGHIVLCPQLAATGLWPAIDIVKSISRPMAQFIDSTILNRSQLIRRLVAHHELHSDLIEFGGYQKGGDLLLDLAIQYASEIRAFRMQGPNESVSWKSTQHSLERLASLLHSAERLTSPPVT